MIGTVKCVYETPCGWCTKWDKKCDEQSQEPQDIPTVYNKCISCASILTKSGCKGCGPIGDFENYQERGSYNAK